MIYNFNLGIGWASSGVEYAQSYRAKMFRNIDAPAKFIFTDFISHENIEHLTKNIGFLDEEVIWLYSYFTDFKIAPVSYTLDDLKKSLPNNEYTYSRNGKIGRIVFNNSDFYTVFFVDEKSDLVWTVEIVSNGCLIRKDYFTYGRLFSEYYAPLNHKAHMYVRRFFNTDGSIAYEEINDDNDTMYEFKDRIIDTKQDFVSYFVSKLNLSENDICIIDRMTDIGQPILESCGKAKVCSVIHADHFSEESTNDDYILWNNYYEYDFAMNKHISFYVSATDAQNNLFKEQCKKYMGVEPIVYTIPVGSLKELKYPTIRRKPFSIITASRLASEKHIDWSIEAVVKAHESIPQLTFDIYGKGGEEEKLNKLIQKYNAENYIKLRGQQNLDDVYQDYELYLSGSTSEGFGLTLMEAVGAGLPIIGFNVRYGNPTFIDDGQNGYLIDINDHMTKEETINELYKRIVELFTNANLDSFHEHSYEKASEYLTKEIEKKWAKVVK